MLNKPASRFLLPLFMAGGVFSLLLTGCSSSIDKEVTLVEGETTIAQVEDLLGSPTEKAHENGRLRYDYNSQSLTRDIVTELLIGWQFLDNHVLTLCERGRTSCTTYKGKADEDAKSLRIYFKKGIVDDAYILNL